MQLIQLLVFALALGQLLSAYLGGFNGQGSFSSPIITPAGYTFSIWGIIILGCLAYGVRQLFPSKKSVQIYHSLTIPLSIVFLGFSLWIWAASQDWLWPTVYIFLTMLIGLWVAYRRIQNQRLDPLDNWVIKGTLGMYLGWSTVAIILNIAATLVFYRVISPGIESMYTYIVILLAALIHALIGQKLIGKNYFYTAAVIWAFCGVAVATWSQGSIILTLISLSAVLIVAGFAFQIKRY